MSDLFFEDFAPGTVETFGAYEVSEAEVIAFASAYDPQPMHVDGAAGALSMLGGLSASGWHSCAILMRLICDDFLLRTVRRGAPAVKANRWAAPVYPGDRLSVRRTVLEAAPGGPEEGHVTFHFELLKADGARAMEQTCVISMARRAPLPA